MSQHSWLECSHSHRLYMTSGADADTDAAQLPGDGSEVAQRPEDRVPQVCGVFTADDDWRGTVAEAGVVQAGNTLPAVPSGELGLHVAERRVRRALCRSAVAAGHAGATASAGTLSLPRRVPSSPAVITRVTLPARDTATHAEPGSRRSISHSLPKSRINPASFPVSSPCSSSSRGAGTVAAG